MHPTSSVSSSSFRNHNPFHAFQAEREHQAQKDLVEWWDAFKTAFRSPEEKEEALKKMPIALFSALKKLSGMQPLDGALILELLTEHKRITRVDIEFSTSISISLSKTTSFSNVTASLELLVRLFSLCPSDSSSEQLLIQAATKILLECAPQRVADLLNAARVTFLDAIVSAEFKFKLIAICCLKTPAIAGQESRLAAKLSEMPSSAVRNCALICMKLIADEEVTWIELLLHTPGEAELRMRELHRQLHPTEFQKLGSDQAERLVSQAVKCLQSTIIIEGCLKRLSLEICCNLVSRFLKVAPKKRLDYAFMLSTKIATELVNSPDQRIPVRAATDMLDQIRIRAMQNPQNSLLVLSYKLLSLEASPEILRNAARFSWHYRFQLDRSTHDAASAYTLSQITTNFQLRGIENIEVENFYAELNRFFVEEPEALIELKRLSNQISLESDKQLRYQVAESLLATIQLLIHSPVEGYPKEVVFEWIIQPWAHIIIGREETQTLISDLLGLCCRYPREAISSSLLPKMLLLFLQWDRENSQSIAKEYLEDLFTESSDGGYSLFPYRLTTYFIRQGLLLQKHLKELLLDPCFQYYPLSCGITAPLIECFQMPRVGRVALNVLEKLVKSIDRNIPNEVLVGLELLHDRHHYLSQGKSKEIQRWREHLAEDRPSLQCFVSQNGKQPSSALTKQQLLGQYLYNLQGARITGQGLPNPLPESVLESESNTALEKAMWGVIRREELFIQACEARSIEEWAALAEKQQIGTRQPLYTILMASELLKMEVGRTKRITQKGMQEWLDRLFTLLNNQDTRLHSEATWEWLAALAREVRKRDPHEIMALFRLFKQHQEATPPNLVQSNHSTFFLTTSYNLSPLAQQAIRVGLHQLNTLHHP